MPIEGISTFLASCAQLRVGRLSASDLNFKEAQSICRRIDRTRDRSHQPLSVHSLFVRSSPPGCLPLVTPSSPGTRSRSTTQPPPPPVLGWLMHRRGRELLSPSTFVSASSAICTERGQSCKAPSAAVRMRRDPCPAHTANANVPAVSRMCQILLAGSWSCVHAAPRLPPAPHPRAPVDNHL